MEIKQPLVYPVWSLLLDVLLFFLFLMNREQLKRYL